MPKPPPLLPQNTSTTLFSISDNFSFHASPESFITSRILQLQQDQPDILDRQRRAVIRIKILNRNIAVVTGYDHIRQVLLGQADQDGGGGGSGNEKLNSSGTSAYVAGKAYDALMAAFFPGPNLLLADGLVHAEMRKSWDRRMESCYDRKFESRVQGVIDEYCVQMFSPTTASSQAFDLYESLKILSWRILLKAFLNLDSNNSLFEEVKGLQEVLLRGQFSLVPISVNTRLWKSPRKRGIDAREKLQHLLARHLSEDADGIWGKISREQIYHVTNHVLMMTSSLAVKGMASLLTAFVLNIYGFVDGGVPLYEQLRKLQARSDRLDQLRSIYLETERLSPPIVGIMRRATEDRVLYNTGEEPDVLIRKGWDVWLYFVGGTRDKEVFGDNSDLFDPRRYLNDHTPEPVGFGLGPKSCLGQDLIRRIVLSFAERLLLSSDELQIDDLEPGVKGWLGWNIASIEQWASDMKQLPTQHPTRPVFVRVSRA